MESSIKLHHYRYSIWGLQFSIGNALLFLFCGLVVLSFFISFFCCAPRFGPIERDPETAPLLVDEEEHSPQ